MDRSADGPPSGHDLDLLKAVHDTARPLEARLPSRLADWFVWKALVIETVIWVIFAYAFIAFLRFYIRFVDIHTYRWPIVIRGLAIAIILLPALLAIVYKWMRGPRGQLIIAESWALLLIGLPISTIQLVADTNRKLDDSPAVVVTHTFDHCEKRAHRRERAIWYSFHMWLRDPGGDPKLPSNIRVPEDVCRAGTAGDPIEITIGKGLWGVPHYREIRVRTTSWEP
jgi:hypothetical protein